MAIWADMTKYNYKHKSVTTGIDYMDEFFVASFSTFGSWVKVATIIPKIEGTAEIIVSFSKYPNEAYNSDGNKGLIQLRDKNGNILLEANAGGTSSSNVNYTSEFNAFFPVYVYAKIPAPGDYIRYVPNRIAVRYNILDKGIAFNIF